MKIALFNLPIDSNYGGNLQRYALVKVLQEMGHEVVHMNMHYVPHVSILTKLNWIIKQIVKIVLTGRSHMLSWKKFIYSTDIDRCLVANPFYERYIPHTIPIYRKDDLPIDDTYGAFIVGSDQVWRPCMTKSYGLSTYFFDFLPENNAAIRLAYAVSMGVSKKELDEKDIVCLGDLYKNFSGVSLRESDSLKLLAEYGWTNPQAEFVLDPTLLLDKSAYEKIIEENDTEPSLGNMFCYILDPSKEKEVIIKDLSKEQKLCPFFQIGCSSIDAMSIPQWLRSFRDADCIVTDSYHGFVFSLIFNKPVKILMNKQRGNARFESLANVIGIDLCTPDWNWSSINSKIEANRVKSVDFLEKHLL